MLALFGSFVLLGGAVGLQTIKKDVVIVGGGASGIYTGIQLLDNGKDVAIIERSSFIGGHVNVYYDPATGQPKNVAVQSYQNTSVVNDFFERLNVTAVREPFARFPTEYVDFVAGQAEPNYTPPAFGDVLQAMEKFLGILTDKFAYLKYGYFLPDPIPDELFLPFSQFAANNGIEALIPTMLALNVPIEVWKEPTINVLGHFGPESAQQFLSAVTEGGLYRPHDISEIYRKAGAMLGDRIHLNSTVQFVRRTKDGVLVVAHTPNGPICIEAGKIVMAAPPVLPNLVGWDLSPHEANLFGKFQSRDVHVGVFRNPPLNNTAYTGVGPNASAWNDIPMPGVLYITPTGFSDGSYYSEVGAPYEISIPDAQAILLQEIETLQSNGAIPAGETEIVEWWNHHTYKVHVSNDDIKAGFYKDLNGLQGVSNTFYTGAALAGHDSTRIWTAVHLLLPQILA